MCATERNAMTDIEKRLKALEQWKESVGAIDAAAYFPKKNRRGFQFSDTSLRRLEGVHPDLVAIAHYALRVSDIDFGIPATGGLRTIQTQKILVEKGKSKTMNSRHLTGHALDVYAWVDGKPSWRPDKLLRVHECFDHAALQFDVKLRWGGDWDGDGVHEYRENDLVHHELPRGVYGELFNVRSPGAHRFMQFVKTENVLHGL